MAVTTVDISAPFEKIAPVSLAESWDNPGWQLHVPGAEVRGVLLAMEATLDVLAEAERLGCTVIFTHHPTIFKPVKSLDLGSFPGTVLGQAMRQGVSIWSAHTNLDVMPRGTSYALASVLGLKNPVVLSRTRSREYKVTVYVPTGSVDAVKQAMSDAGAGHIGDYSDCFWQVEGMGQFKPEVGADPYLGKVGEIERTAEYKIETVVHHANVARVVEAMRRAHPYEEVAYDLFPLENRVVSPLFDYGYGCVGAVEQPTSTVDFARRAASALSSAVCTVAGRPDRLHERVAVVGGSGTSFIPDAASSGATLFITADVRYHDAQDAVARGLDLIVLDHYATERPVLDLVRASLSELLPGVPVHVSASSSTPYVRVEP